MNKKFKLIVILPLFVLTFVSCVTVSNIGTDNWRDYFKPGSTKEEIAKDFNLYRGKWWNFYVRNVGMPKEVTMMKPFRISRNL